MPITYNVKRYNEEINSTFFSQPGISLLSKIENNFYIHFIYSECYEPGNFFIW